ncbi:hypothetical protein [Treponema sp.]|uniref:hypothetical protein n=1 Tax=Treponema sp. TaxID=166 RepID=UPI00257C9319|nr:hypothetical protein [Treponema sp.]
MYTKIQSMETNQSAGYHPLVQKYRMKQDCLHPQAGGQVPFRQVFVLNCFRLKADANIVLLPSHIFLFLLANALYFLL